MKVLLSAIDSRKFAPAYYFIGEAEYRKDEGLRRLLDVAVDPATRDFNLDVRKGGEIDAATLGSLLGAPPMMAERRVVVIKDVDALRKDARKVLDAYLEQPAADTLLVMRSSADAKVDKGLAQSAIAIEFDALTGVELPKWIAKRAAELGTSIEPSAAELLQDAVGADQAMLAVELEKLVAYSGSRPINEAAVSAVVGVQRSETMASLLDAVLDKDATRALSLLEPVLQQPKTNAVQIVMALTTQTLAMAVVAARRIPMAGRKNEFFNVLKSSGSNFTGRAWGEAVSAWTKASALWSLADLRHAIDALLHADLTIKNSRVSSEEQVLATAILAMCGAGATQHAA